MINTRLNPTRPVQVINAGVQAFSLEQNLVRLANDILPLKPDLIKRTGLEFHRFSPFYASGAAAVGRKYFRGYS